jgi:hypothetical protein
MGTDPSRGTYGTATMTRVATRGLSPFSPLPLFVAIFFTAGVRYV